MRTWFYAIAALGLVVSQLALAPSAVAQERPNRARDMMRERGGGGLVGDSLARAIAVAGANALGSKDNPVRENMPQGQRAYLSRLRCSDGSAPVFMRGGNVGTGVFGNIVDLYKVTCHGAAAVDVYMDMYHDGPETKPVPGFTMAMEAGPHL